MRLVVGLGNPGPEYADTRHNLGFRVVELLAERRGVTLSDPLCGSRVGRAEDLLLAAPQTFMNRSGLAVRCLAERESLAGDQILVVYDDVSLPLGRLRLRGEGGPGGHRGLSSVIENLRSAEVPRLRLGIGPAPPEADLAEWVLAPFTEAERGATEAMIERAADACEAWAREPLAAVASRVNSPVAGEAVDAAPSS